MAKKFKLLDWNRDGKGVVGYEDTTPTVRYYFKLFRRRFSQILSLNLMMLPLLIPIALIVYIYLSIPKTGTMSSPAFSVLSGTSLFTSSPSVQFPLSLSSLQLNIPIYHATGYYIGIALIALFVLGTWGLQHVGITYVARGLVRGDSFVFSDYFYGIRKNWKHAIGVGIFDVLVIAFLTYDLIFFISNPSSFTNDLMLFLTGAMAVVYLFMRFYLWLLLITFNIKFFKMLKNSVIFTILGIKRNLVAALWILIVAAVNVLLVIMFWQINIVIPLILPLVYFLGLCLFTTTYAAYPVIKKYMIDPYYTPDGKRKPTEKAEEKVPPAAQDAPDKAT